MTMTVYERLTRCVLLATAALVVAFLLSLFSGSLAAAATFTVNETGDEVDADITDDRCDSASTTGRQCTLRAAIEEANDTAGSDDIVFDLGGTGGQAISPTSELPTISDTLTIDGYTQAGASPNTLEEGNDAVLNVILGGLSAGTNANGLSIAASDCVVKGLVIRNFEGYGVLTTGSGATGNRIEGNFIGLNRDGTTDKGNGIGVLVEGDSHTVGGTQPEQRNVISGNGSYGMYISPTATDTRVEGNFIGTTADGDAELGNGAHGMYIQGDSNTVGGTAAGAGNVVSGNDFYGIFVSGLSGGNENTIEGNFIGTTADGSDDLGNVRAGVTLQNGPDFTKVGGTLPGAANRIAYNGEDGVSVADNGVSTGNSILSNRIYRNGGLGIDLNADGVTTNDPGDADAGANNQQNFPTISSATRSTFTEETTISGRLSSNPSQDFTVQCFLTGGAPASGYGEGFRLLDTTTVSTGASGGAKFSCTSIFPPLGQIPGQTVTATATNEATGDTSEFAKNKTITNAP